MASTARTNFNAGDAPTPDDAQDWRSALGRVGLVARGVLYGVLGILALQFAFGSTSSGQVSSQGAIAYVQQQPFGTVMLWLLAVGLAALALWQLITAFTGDPVKGSEAKDRAMYALKAVLYGATAIAAFAALGIGGGSSGGGGGSGQTKATAYLLDLPYGQWIVGAIGVGVVGYAVKTLVEHAKDAKFMERLATARLDRSTVEGVRAAGRAGYGARGTIIGITGIFLVVAALRHSPDSTRGLSGALVVLSQQAYGTILLTVVALGLFLFGVFSVIEARYRRAA